MRTEKKSARRLPYRWITLWTALALLQALSFGGDGSAAEKIDAS